MQPDDPILEALCTGPKHLSELPKTPHRRQIMLSLEARGYIQLTQLGWKFTGKGWGYSLSRGHYPISKPYFDDLERRA